MSPVRKGTYVLFMTLREETPITAGALGPHAFSPGLYCYVGSAMGGLDQRLSRHLRRNKTIRWHIDRLTVAADRAEAWESYPDPIPECVLARTAVECGTLPVHPGFGCSDCRCMTHLFIVPEGTDRGLVSRCGLKRFVLTTQVVND